MTQRRSQSVGSNKQGLEECNPLLIPVRKSQTFSNAHKILEPELKHSANERTSWANPRQAVRVGAVCQTKNKMEKKGLLVGRCHAEKILSEELVLRNGVNEFPTASGVTIKHPTSLNLLQLSSCPVSDRPSNQKMPNASHERDSLMLSSFSMSDRLSNQKIPNASHERHSLMLSSFSMSDRPSNQKMPNASHERDSLMLSSFSMSDRPSNEKMPNASHERHSLMLSSLSMSDRLSNQKMPNASHERHSLMLSSLSMSDRLSNQKIPNASHERDPLQVSSCPVSERPSNQKIPNTPHERDSLEVSSSPLSDRLSNQMMPNAPHQRESLEKLFLDLDLAEFRNEEEDSASDLSDSERLPIPPSPLAPPEMNLRAEEISPGYFSLYAKPKSEVYSYPDFLPPPYNSWNLSEVSTFLNKEGKNTLKSMPSGCLERYIDRLLQLEWLQIQTVQAEKAKPVKARSQTAPGLFHNGKYLGKSKSWHSSSPTKQTSIPDNTCKMSCAQERGSHRRYPQREMSDLPCMRRPPPKGNGSVDLSSPVLRNTQDIKAGAKKKSVTNSQQDKKVSSCGGSSKMYNTGNLRPTKQGTASNHTPSTPKQAKSCKLKKVSNPSSPMSDTDYSLTKRNGKNSHPPSCKLKAK